MNHVHWKALSPKARRIVKAYLERKDVIAAWMVTYRKRGTDRVLLVDDLVRFKREHWQAIDAGTYRLVDKE